MKDTQKSKYVETKKIRRFNRRFIKAEVQEKIKMQVLMRDENKKIHQRHWKTGVG